MIRRLWVDKAVLRDPAAPCVVVQTPTGTVTVDEARGRAFRFVKGQPGPVVDGRRIRVWLETEDPVEVRQGETWREV